MISYLGVRCPVCNKKFTATDDIVVCPVCGAPHHRQCYSAQNACAFAADHLKGMEWRPPPAESPPDSDQPGAIPGTCPVCGSENPEGAIFCLICGSRMFGRDARTDAAEQDTPSGMFPGLVTPNSVNVNPNDEAAGISFRDFALYVGPNASYYLPRFSVLDKNSSFFAPNFSAFIFGFLFYFYRKMYTQGTVLLGLFIAVMLSSFFYTWEALPRILFEWNIIPTLPPVNDAMINRYETIVGAIRIISTVTSLVFSLCANRLYFTKAVQDIIEFRELCAQSTNITAGSREYRHILTSIGGVNKLLVICLIGTLALLFFIACFFVSLNAPF